jgi:hypothetical protein
MINIVIGSAEAFVAEVLIKAFERSYTRGQIQIVESLRELPNGGIVVVPAPRDAQVEQLRAFVRRPSKVVIFGNLGAEAAAFAGIGLHPLDPSIVAAAECRAAPIHGTSASEAVIAYSTVGIGASSPLRRRHLCRFDFGNEWNNLGYGRIGIGSEPWSIAATAKTSGATVVGDLVVADEAPVGSVATVHDLPTVSLLWFARPLGPIDGADWRIVETFISGYRHESLPCRPHLRDIPHGVAAAVTMRLDCDEAIATVRPLLDLYRARGLPLSVSVMTGQPACSADITLLMDVREAGGSILSHSATHPANWGGSAKAAEIEAVESKHWLESRVPRLNVRYAVSPFHQNPMYVPLALARAGYSGFVGGTIANDLEYLMPRGGSVPYGPSGLISQSQSCMLHGDCMLPGGVPLRIYREAFQIARAGGQFFGYLDHPFSARYAYGWPGETDRLRRHDDFLDFIKADCDAAGGRLLFVNEDTCLDFMLEKAATEIAFDVKSNQFEISKGVAAGLPLSIGFRGRNQAASG